MKRMTAVIFLLFAFSLNAQEKTGQKSPVIDTLKTPAITVVDQNNSEQIAKDMSVELMQRLNLTMEQTSSVTEIIKDYVDQVREIQKNAQAQTGNGNNTDTSGLNMAFEKTDDYNTGLRGNSAIQDDLEKVNLEANKEIEDKLKEDQLSTYNFIKNEWWDKLKSRVFEGKTRADLENEENRDKQNIDTKDESGQRQMDQTDQNRNDNQGNQTDQNQMNNNQNNTDSTGVNSNTK